MPSTIIPINAVSSALHCPICRQVNSCRANNAKNCWCMTLEIPAQLLALLPIDEINSRCICQQCISLFKNQPNEIKRMLQRQL
ncbi:MAG: cysteine-rich CWC family protein [Psychrobium sp.]|nr:cysteine-rich CWC family protein [Psychrobium sp.]